MLNSNNAIQIAQIQQLPQLRIFVQRKAGVEAKKEFPKDPVWINSKKRFAKSDKPSNVQNRIRRELMKLHAIDKEKPTKKFMGRKRKATKEKGKEHHPVSLQWLWNTLVAGEDDQCRCWKKPSFLAFFRSVSSNDEGTHLRAIVLSPFFTIFTLCTTFLMGMQGWSARGCEERASARKKKQRRQR